ncbi:MAG: FkbM family methyltransferase [Magnetococcales bacterium]|nr:FkbM family methyltransferase [Magnetococcales bacterium]
MMHRLNPILKSHVHQALLAVEEGREVDRVGVGAGLAEVFGRPPADEEVEAAITQLRMIPAFLTMEERIDVVMSTLDEASPDAPFLQEQQASVEALFQAAALNEPLSLPVRHDFGVISARHEQVLIKAIQEQHLSRAQAMSFINDGVRLTAHLAGLNACVLPLEFRTTDHNGMPQVTRPLETLLFQEPVSIQTPGETFIMAISSESELRQMAMPEMDTVEWLNQTIEPDSVLYDVGANVGYFSIYAVAMRPGVRAVAFEPAPLNVARLNTNIHLNKMGGSVMAFPIALSDESGVVRFGNSYFVSGGWSHSGIDGRKNSSADTFFSGCISYTLDDFIRSARFLPPPTHLKVDVDGPELKVLRGAMATLANLGLRHLLIEMRDDREVQEAETMLNALGFYRVGLRTEGLGNRIFIRSASPR